MPGFAMPGISGIHGHDMVLKSRSLLGTGLRQKGWRNLDEPLRPRVVAHVNGRSVLLGGETSPLPQPPLAAQPRSRYS